MEDSLIISSARPDQPPLGGEGVDGLWCAAKSALADRLSPGSYKSWIEPLKIHSAEGGRLVLAGPNPFFLNWVKNHFSGDLAAALAAVGFPAAAPLEFITDPGPAGAEEGGAPVPAEAPAQGPAPNQLRIAQPLSPGERFTFDNFVVGNSNHYAYEAVKDLAAGSSLGADALFLTSDHGLGKSHLAMALSRTFLQNQPRRQVCYLTAEEFTNEMVQAIHHKTMEQFKVKYRQNCDVLVLEELQFLAGKEKIQTEFCFTLDCLLERGKKVVFTSPQEPKGIPRLSQKLRSRLSAVLVSPIGPPEYETRLNILVKKAKSMGLKVSRPVLEYVAERVTTDVRRLESCLISLKAKSQLLARQVDLDMAREALNYLFEEPREGGLTPLAVRTLICRHFHLESSVVTSKNRSARVNEARNLGIYVARQVTGRTLEEIGQVFGRSHSSALYAINKMDGDIKRDVKLAGKVEFFSRLLLGQAD